MKDIIIYSIWLLGAFGLVILAAIMAFKGIDGWGWFLFVGVLCLWGFSYADDKTQGGGE